MKKKIAILIVEDEVILSAWMKMQLEDEGYSVCGSVTSGKEAIEFVKKKRPDLILMDIHLVGGMNGIEAAREISEKYPCPIIFMTGYDTPEIIEQAQKINPAACLSKPVEIWDLKPIIESIFDKQIH